MGDCSSMYRPPQSDKKISTDTLHAQAQLSSCSQLLVVHQQYEESLLPCSHASIGIYRNRYSWQLFLLKKEKLGIKTLVLPRGTYLRFSRLKIESFPIQWRGSIPVCLVTSEILKHSWRSKILPISEDLLRYEALFLHFSSPNQYTVIPNLNPPVNISKDRGKSLFLFEKVRRCTLSGVHQRH